MTLKEPLSRLDSSPELYNRILPLCRLKQGEIWEDPIGKHRVGVVDATNAEEVSSIVGDTKPSLLATDPPYNLLLGKKRSKSLFKTSIAHYIDFSKKWIKTVIPLLADDCHLYIWLGADQTDGFQPLPEFMLMMREIPGIASRSFITVRNQRGYGTQKNWMCIRQELLYYVKGSPDFNVVYTEIPKVLKGYYKTVGGRRTENVERSRSDTIRPGNVWLDIQQVFYRMEENVPGAYAQKPLSAMERIIATSSSAGDTILDCFSHSGTTLIASEKLERNCVSFDIDPVFAELTIRRLERYRETGKTGWQCEHPFPELQEQKHL
jgi:site-specific DNA-methyltransferase (adenine-specific)